MRTYRSVQQSRSAAWTLAIAAGIFTLKAIVSATTLVLSDNHDNVTIANLGYTILFAVSLGGASLVCYSRLWRFGSPFLPDIQVAGVQQSAGISRNSFDQLGLLRYPNARHCGWRADTLLRVLLALLGVAALLLLITVTLFEPFGLPLSEIMRNLQLLQTAASSMPAGIALLLALIAVAFAVWILTQHAHYQLISFRASLSAYAVASVFALMGAASFLESDVLAACCLLALVLLAVRMVVDLRALDQYIQRKNVCDRILSSFQDGLDYLRELRNELEFRLEPLDIHSIARRISRGLKDSEKYSLFVLRHAAHFVRVAAIWHMPMFAAIMRFLTVDREVTLGGGVSSTEPLRSPMVPVWDVQLFPVKVPQGFEERDDLLALDDSWSVVESCWRCLGSGWIMETGYYTESETYTDSEGKSTTRTITNSRLEQRICPECFGCGRLKYRQCLKTVWRCLTALKTNPETPVPDLMERAEEKTFLTTLIVEGFHPVAEDAHISLPAPSPIVGALTRSSQIAKWKRTEHAKLVASVLPGRLYRSDFRVCGFHALRVRFDGLRSLEAWFFGVRPECHLPRLPCSYSAVVTVCLLPPLVIACIQLLGLLW